MILNFEFFFFSIGLTTVYERWGFCDLLWMFLETRGEKDIPAVIGVIAT